MGLPSEEAVPIAGHEIQLAARAPQLTADARRLLEGPILSTLLRLAIPTVALMVFQAIIAVGETVFVGWLGVSALAGASLTFPLVILMSALSAGAYGGAVSSRVARALGAGQMEDAAAVAGTSLTMAALMGVIFTLVMLSGGRAFYSSLGASGEALELAVRYSDLIFLGSVPYWLLNAAASILRGGGNTAYPAMCSAIGSVITLSISPLLIFGFRAIPGFGLTGAACTVIGYNVVLSAVLLRAVWSARCPARPTLRMLIPRWKYAYEVLRVAVPGAGSTLLGNLTFIILIALVAPFGTAATAGYGVSGRLEYLLVPIVFGIGTALIPLVAANDGAGNHVRVRQCIRAASAVSAGICGLIGGAAALCSTRWMALFTSDANVVEIGEAYLIRVGPAYAFLGLGLALYFASQGRGRTVQPLLASLTRLLVAGAGGLLAVRIHEWDLANLFTIMAGGLVAYGLVMVFVMRRELGLVASGS
jgi:putative MATE family efflux protein